RSLCIEIPDCAFDSGLRKRLAGKFRQAVRTPARAELGPVEETRGQPVQEKIPSGLRGLGRVEVARHGRGFAPAGQRVRTTGALRFKLDQDRVPDRDVTT